MNFSSVVQKRLFDLVFSVIGLLLLFPFIVISVLISRYDTGGSGIFSQQRVGRYGRLITVYKIRTMHYKNSDKNLTITALNDNRITPAGKYLRKWKIDELPQLWNVLKGDMSFVGPRPDVPGYADELTGENREILKLRPGITGPASIKYSDEELILQLSTDAVNYNDTVIYPDKVKLNLKYIKNWSLIKDIRFILITCGLLARPSCLTISLDTVTSEVKTGD